MKSDKGFADGTGSLRQPVSLWGSPGYPAPSLAEVFRVMVNHFGVALMTEMTGATTADLARWIKGYPTNASQESRLRTGYTVFTMLTEACGSESAYQWMFVKQPCLDESAGIDAIRQGHLQAVIDAAWTYTND